MTTQSIRLSAPRLRVLATTCAPLVFSTLLACSSRVAPTSADREVGDARVATVIDAGEGSATAEDGATAEDSATTLLDAGPGADVVPWDQVSPVLAEVSGREVEVVEGGAGRSTVVFESGLGDDWTSWDEVAAEIAPHARVFAYSRPGYGASEPTTGPRTATRIALDLRALLAARRFAPPYVLVGHSFGGAYMELFAKAYPHEVAGLVLVDPRHRDLTTACQAAELEGCTIPDSIVATLPQVQVAEIEAYANVSEEIRAAGSFGRYPVRVLTATAHGFDSKVEALWESLLGSLAGEAADGEQIVFNGAGHVLQAERPREVAEAIRNVIASASR